MIIDLREASVRYRATGLQVLHGVDLSVDSGDFALVSGPSGCGKSTLLRLVNGLVPHAYRAEVTGHVHVGGRPVAGQTISQLSTVVGTLLQDPHKQMDLRAFGARRRTWMRELSYDRTDYLLLAGFAVLAVVVLAYKIFGVDVVWVP